MYQLWQPDHSSSPPVFNVIGLILVVQSLIFCVVFYDSEALATWTSVRVSFTAPFLLFACMICFNFVIACWLYCFNVDVFVLVFFIFGNKLLRAYVFCLYYMPNWNKVLLTYFVFVFRLPPLFGSLYCFCPSIYDLWLPLMVSLTFSSIRTYLTTIIYHKMSDNGFINYTYLEMDIIIKLWKVVLPWTR